MADVIDPIAKFTKYYGDRFCTKIAKCSSNLTQITLYSNGALFDISANTDIKVKLSDGTNEYCATRLISPTLFDLAVSTGVFNVALGSLVTVAGNYDLEVTYFDLDNVAGAVFTSQRNLTVTVV